MFGNNPFLLSDVVLSFQKSEHAFFHANFVYSGKFLVVV